MALFNSKVTKSAPLDSASINIISRGTSINGDITSSGDMRIEGSVTGSLNTKSKLVLGETGEVNGNIAAGDAVIAGSIVGNILVSEVLFLKSTARIFGDITTGKLVVESGAEFNGTCKMKSDWAGKVTKQDGASESQSKPTQGK